MTEEQMVRTLETSIELVTLRKAVKEMRAYLNLGAQYANSFSAEVAYRAALSELNRLAPPKEEKQNAYGGVE